MSKLTESILLLLFLVCVPMYLLFGLGLSDNATRILMPGFALVSSILLLVGFTMVICRED